MKPELTVLMKASSNLTDQLKRTALLVKHTPATEDKTAEGFTVLVVLPGDNQ
jgi:hypothetical protein